MGIGHVDLENKIGKFWEENKTFEKSVERRPKDKEYIFYDGPPFATGTPHYGHILGLTSKDLFPRYWTMKGFRVERRWGWDCHGLPIENIAEKELGIKNKKQIEEMGIDKFNEFCRSKVFGFINEWKKTVKRMGKWIEFDNSYKTMDSSYMETVWWIFKTLHDKGYVYEGKKVLMYCPRCQTPIANAEIDMDNSYKDITEKTITTKFELKDEKGTYFLAWTTTPWTLIGNAALAVNENLTYVKVESGTEKYILIKDRLKEVFKNKTYKILEEFKGSKLVGKNYLPLYSLETKNKGHYVIAGGNEVTSEDGTGIVHMATYGEFDYEMIKKYKLPIFQHIGNNGTLVAGPKEWLGMWFKEVDKKVLEDLDNRGVTFSTENYTHSYPFCYRCNTPLIYNAVASWFIDITKIKKEILKRGKEIKWHPASKMEKRFLNIVKTAPDWCIARNRYWATAIPVWKCSCGNQKIIGSIEELSKSAIEKVPKDLDLHKHIVDNIHLKCEKCGKKMERIPEVLDCWMESGAMPYASKHYPFENKEKFDSIFPADFVSEYVAQVRTWFYYMHVLGVLLFDHAPFQHVVVTGNILASDGQKMSKSKNNFPDPSLMFDKFGADSLRFYLMSNPVMNGEDINFNEEVLKDINRKVYGLLSNIKSFYELFNDGKGELDNTKSKNLLDIWLISKTNKLIKDVTESLDNYDTVNACAKILDYIGELSTWYVRRSRDRFKGKDLKNKQAAINTLGYALRNLSLVIAPITPFIAEDVHQALMKGHKLEESVHLELWPKSNSKAIDQEIMKNMDLTRDLVSKALSEREVAKIPIKQPLATLTILGAKLETEYLDLIKDELNVKEIKLKAGKEVKMELDTKITPGLLQERISRELIRNINELRKQENLTLKDKIELCIEASSDLIKKSAERFKQSIMDSVQADKLEFRSCEKSKEFIIDKEKVKIGFSK